MKQLSQGAWWLVGTVASGLIGYAIGEWDPKSVFLRSSDTPLNGSWTCSWRYSQPRQGSDSLVEDVVKLAELGDSRVEGEGANRYYGQYRLEGMSSLSVLAMTYREQREPRAKLGVVLLQKKSGRQRIDSLRGYWVQVLADTIALGPAACTKL
jgi:hypothetical protein